MSTFGNKGERERNPNKPKFAALDINSLYRSTRGETFEPATQKNAAPRKHGMQSLGKVPSARRPPANLPSLKAETSIPAIPPTQVSNEQQQTTANSASWADSNLSGTQNSTINTVSSNNNPALSNINHNNTNSNSQVQGNQLQQQQQHHQGASNNSNNNNNNSNNSSTWSAVATGAVKEDSASQPPLYQSPQFQNEFPSLDGTLMTTTLSGSIQNVNAQQQKLQNQNSFDSGGGNLNLRPSTDVASWMQQQQQLNSANSGNVRGAGGENFQTPEIDGPPKVMALMPSFLRGGNTGIANINTAPSSAPSGPQSQPNYQQHKSNMNNNNNNNGMGNRSGRQNNNNNNNNKYDNSSHYNEYSNGLPPRHRQQPPRHYSGRQNNNNNNNNNSNNDDRSSFEPEVIVQRPIIKEEELERIDSLARDDAWSKHDEVDYNKKLQFSDDEADDMKMKDDRKIDVWRDSEKREMKQQNGPRSIDPTYIEKMKMVREEEERLERERKVAAQRKLQELEEKSKQQKMQQISLDKSHEKEIEEKPISGINYTINDSDKKVDHQQSQQQQTQRDYGKPSKYMNDNKFDVYDSQYGRNNNAGGADYIKKTTFQSNLPPRFQKQQQYGDRPDDRREKGPQNNYKPLHQQDSKNIPFIQHPQSSYDQQQQQQQNQQQQQRWMQYNKGNQGNPPRRNMSSLSQSSSDDNRQNNSKQPYNSRRRQESEEDDYGRFIKESANTGSLKKSQTVPSAQISRSMSDSSDKLSDHNRSEKSTSREFLTGSNVCWAEVCENDKRSSLDAKEKRRVSESSAISDDQPRTILQRNKPLQEQLTVKENVVKKESCKETKEDEQKTVLSEQSPPKELVEIEKKEKVVETVPIDQQQGLQSKKSLDIIPEKEQNIMAEKVQQLDNSTNMMKSKDMPPKDLDDSRHSGGSNKRSPHSNRYEPSMRGGRGNSSYGGYRGNWQRRGGSGGHSRSGRYDYSDSENSEEYDQDSWNRKPNRKDINRRDNYGTSGLQKEGFSPRGEPSRRGRGGGSSMTTSQSNFRRTGSNTSNNSITATVKRIDNYGPPSSKSPFSTSDEKSGTSDKKDVIKEKEKLSDDDRMKQKQKALSDGLINKNMKDNTNLVMQKASSPTSKSNEESANKQHSNDIQQPITQSASSSSITQDIKKEIVADEKNSNDAKNRATNAPVTQSYNSRQQQPKFDSNKSTAPINKSTINKSSVSSTQQSSTGKLPVSSVSTSTLTSTTTVTMTSQTSTTSQYNNSGMNNSKQIDSRNSSQTNNKYDNSNNYRDSRTNDPRNNGSNNRMAPRFAKQQRDPTSSNQRVSGNYWDKNNVEGLNDESNKISLMQQLNSSNSSGSLSNQQISTSTNNSNVLKTDMIKQQQQQQVGQQSQQNPQNPQNQSMTTSSSTGNQPMLDGASLPKQTLIFENTSYKSAPPSLKRPPQLGGPPNAMNQHPQKDSTPTINEMIEQQAKDHSLTSALQNLSFGQKSDIVDMNSFKFSFDTQLTDDGNSGGFGSVSSSSTHTSQAVSKASSLGLVGAKTGMQNSNILNTDALNMKVASCKKVWEEPSVEHSTTNADDVMANFVAQQQLQHYAHNNINAHHTGLSPQSFSYAATSSANDHASSLEHFNKANDNDDSNNYQSQHMNAHVMHSQSQQANMNMKAAEAFATQNANVCKVKPTQMHQSGLSPPPQMQQNPLQQHQQQFYQTPSYANMPTIPSPPVVYNSAQATAGGLYNPYNMDAARAQMYSYPQSATNNSLSFNAFMQTPNIASAPTHEMYQNLSQYRATVQPYNQTPQLNNPNAAAVLISSATPSNSMMSSKSNTPQQIGAIGSKSSAPQNPPTATAGQYNQQQYMNHLYHQNSYYPSSTAQQANPYYNATGTAATGNYGMFGGTTNAPPQQQMNYGSVGQFPLNSQMLNNLVINQQYRSGPVVAAGSSNSGSANSGSNSNTSGYMKQQQQHQSQLQDPVSSTNFFKNNV
ncbi:probable WRKY transcription factor protein 1 isoform X2 [Chironomus tepperi]|uniref:probable WRKY transcription factor protein 1 isoform X2 n=1 Tax=Chironomus tepperi TaxID=113505 RepID=UPI00391F9E21